MRKKLIEHKANNDETKNIYRNINKNCVNIDSKVLIKILEICNRVLIAILIL